MVVNEQDYKWFMVMEAFKKHWMDTNSEATQISNKAGNEQKISTVSKRKESTNDRIIGDHTLCK